MGKWTRNQAMVTWLLSDAAMSSRVNWFSNSALTDYIRASRAKHIFLLLMHVMPDQSFLPGGF